MKVSIPRKWLWLLLFLFVCFTVEVIAAWFTAASVRDWYPSLVKPPWNPPNWLFGPVWTVLYGLMAISIWLIWLKQQRDDSDKSYFMAYFLFGIQLLLNAIWSIFFFEMHQPGLALLDIVLLLGAIVLTMLEFNKHEPVAALLLAPYLLWVTYATSLNAAIWVLNQ